MKLQEPDLFSSRCLKLKGAMIPSRSKNLLFEQDLRANAFRVCELRENRYPPRYPNPGRVFPDHGSNWLISCGSTVCRTDPYASQECNCTTGDSRHKGRGASRGHSRRRPESCWRRRPGRATPVASPARRSSPPAQDPRPKWKQQAVSRQVLSIAAMRRFRNYAKIGIVW
jgi:hypothetical protein